MIWNAAVIMIRMSQFIMIRMSKCFEPQINLESVWKVVGKLLTSFWKTLGQPGEGPLRDTMEHRGHKNWLPDLEISILGSNKIEEASKQKHQHRKIQKKI